MALSKAWGMPDPMPSDPGPPGCPADVWIEYQKLCKAKSSGRADWWHDWEGVLYKPGDIRDDSVCDSYLVKFRHKNCGGEYGHTNPSQTVKKHTCAKVNGQCLQVQ